MKKPAKKPVWSVYILECGDGTFYTGIAIDVKLRLKAHESGKGAKYTKGRGPLKITYTETHKNRSKASKREAEIKNLSRAEKIALFKSFSSITSPSS